MTTAARPTWETARGGSGKGESDLSKISKQYSSRDMPSHTKLKYRQSGQESQDDVKSREFRRDLEERERVSTSSRDRRRGGESSSASSSSSKKPRLEQVSANIDADDAADDDDDEDEDSDEDDTAELMAELNRIKKERAVEKAQQDAEKQAEVDQVRTENILAGNPLLNLGSGSGTKSEFKVKRRWDDDVVFKNCAKGLDDKGNNAYFINDSPLSELIADGTTTWSSRTAPKGWTTRATTPTSSMTPPYLS